MFLPLQIFSPAENPRWSRVWQKAFINSTLYYIRLSIFSTLWDTKTEADGFSIFVFVYYSQEVSSQLHLNYQNLCHCCKLTLSSSWFYLSGIIQVWPQRILGIFQGLAYIHIEFKPLNLNIFMKLFFPYGNGNVSIYHRNFSNLTANIFQKLSSSENPSFC